MAASIATELNAFKEDVSHSRGALVNAIDAWHDNVVKNARGNKEVDVKALARAISDAKVSVLAWSEKVSAQEWRGKKLRKRIEKKQEIRPVWKSDRMQWILDIEKQKINLKPHRNF